MLSGRIDLKSESFANLNSERPIQRSGRADLIASGSGVSAAGEPGRGEGVSRAPRCVTEGSARPNCWVGVIRFEGLMQLFRSYPVILGVIFIVGIIAGTAWADGSAEKLFLK